ncbi:uncharacterized protein LOC133331239 [Musca vetustissima]|uniref:uncharacterized protein LOC133331239 n=1 Tax=Musca vetustissima TaxID=27455 RepID=UPI002AB5F512|nr:uncharacterized protein LOC133331239 [Musca vetustissima]
MNVNRGITVIITLLVTTNLVKATVMRDYYKMKPTWTFELKSIETYSDNPELINFFDWSVDRISRGVYAASGSMAVNYDIVEGDDNEIEFNVYRSENGVKEYKPIPFRVERQHLFSYLSTFYKDLVMETFKGCSNMPVFEDEFEPPLEKKTYTLNKCQIDPDEFPQHLQEGFYKVVMTGYGAVKWQLTFVAIVESAM